MDNRLKEIDYIRAISMIAVIVIHITSGYIFMDTKFTIKDINLAFILNQAARFAVPSFILISGISLNFSKECTPSQFYKRRIKKILIPYIIWGTIYYLYKNGFDINLILQKNFISEFLIGLLTGNMASHLYFISLLFQLYLIYPFIKKVISIKIVLISFVITFTCIYITYLTGLNVYFLPSSIGQFLWMLMPTWLFYFVLGIYLTRERLEKIFIFSRENYLIFIVLFFIYAVFLSFEGKQTNTYELSIRPQLILYVAVYFIAISGLSFYLQKIKLIDSVILFFSKHSMNMYFIHVLILNILRKYSFFDNGISGMLLLFLLVTLLSALFSTILDFISKNLFRKSIHI